MRDQESQICQGNIGKLTGPSHGVDIVAEEIFKGLAKGAYTLGNMDGVRQSEDPGLNGRLGGSRVNTLRKPWMI